MWTCSFCGKSASIFRSEHKECRQRHDDATARIAGFFTRVLRDQIEPEVFHGLMRDLAASAHIRDDEFRTLACRGFGQITDAALGEGVLTEPTESRIKNLASAFGLRADEFADDAGTRFVMAAILRDLGVGKFVQRLRLDGALRINLDKSEQPVWLFQNTGYYTTRAETDQGGGRAGYSLRSMKGGSVRSGSFQGGPIKKEHLSLQAVGKFVIATSNVYFVSTTKAFKVPLKRIIGITAQTDAVTILHDGASARPMIFEVDNPTFVADVIPLLNQL
jgi:hypothetical protein